MHWKVVGEVKRSSSVSSSCRSVVPERQWPMMKIGGPTSLVSAMRRPWRLRCHQLVAELTRLAKLTVLAKP